MIDVVLLKRAAAIVHAAVHLDHIHVFFNERNRWHEILPLQAFGIKRVWRVIRRHHKHDAVLKTVRQQTPQNHRVGNVAHVKLIKANQPKALRQSFGDGHQGISLMLERSQLLVNAAHERMKVNTRLATNFRHRIKRIHQEAFAAPDAAVKIHTAWCGRAREHTTHQRCARVAKRG